MEITIGLAVTLLVAVFGWAVRGYIKTHFTPAQLREVHAIAEMVTTAAEKVGEVVGLDGPTKYEYAESALVSLASKVGVRLKPADANTFIHAVLKEKDELDKLLTETVEAPEAA